MKGQKGIALIETIVALALLSIISVSFLSSLATTSTARAIASERTSAKILAENLMEQVKKHPYASSYDDLLPIEGYPGYTPDITVQSMKNGNIQMITITVSRADQDLLTLESYKVNR